MEALQNKSSTPKTDLSEKSTEDFEVDIGLDGTKCFLIKSIFGDIFPSSVFFKTDYDITEESEANLKNRIDQDITYDWTNIRDRVYCVLYKAYKNLPECINYPMKINGVVRTKSFLKANFIWKLLKIEKMNGLIKSLNKFQRYNHFPLTWQIGRKDNLWRNYKIMNLQFASDFCYQPVTFILPEDKEELLKSIDANPEDLWIIKPVSSSRGRGIRLMTNKDTLPKKCLVSKYISNPHLINNKKYDLRLYVLITGFSPLKIYLLSEGLVRFASEEYSIDSTNMHNRFMHLTNYAINKSSAHFDSNINVENNCQGSKWSLQAFRNYFAENNLNIDKLWKDIQDIVVKAVISIADDTMESVEKLTKHKNNLFELYGFDVLIDADFRPWLMEVNLNPSLNCDTDLDMKIKSCLMANIYNTVGIIPYSHISGKSYFEDKCEVDMKEYEKIAEKFNIPKDPQIFETITYSLDEFSRCGIFERVFPIKDTIDYYTQFIENPGDDNLNLWEWIRKN